MTAPVVGVGRSHGAACPRDVPRVLSIAGTDPTGGAGIQADLKSIAANGGYGMAVVTALVAQNTTGVRRVHVPPADFLAEQLDAVGDDVTVDAVKIGMLFDTPVVDAVAGWLARTRPPVVVLDPVMVAASGDRLLTPAAEDALRALVASADLVTPNLPELASLLGEDPATTWDDALRQGHALAEGHGVLVLVKGGHLDTPDAPDALVDPVSGVVLELSAARVPTTNTHGTGCSLSSAVATLRARTGSWPESVRAAKAWLTESITAADGLDVGRGNGPVSHLAGVWRRGLGPAVTPGAVADAWWEEIRGVREAIDDLPFLERLRDGTLDEHAFTWYLAQDALYLRDYARVLAEASRLAPTAAEQAFWASAAHGAIATELELHASRLPGLFEDSPGDVTTAYLNHLLATAARGDYGEIVAAVLPCFWVYDDVGSRLVHRATPDNPYAPWLRTYGDPEFHALTERAVALVTGHAAGATAAVRERMRQAFVTSARHEHAFFVAPLDRAGQPVGVA